MIAEKSKYGGNNQKDIKETLYEKTTKTYYLSPSDPKYKIYTWHYKVNTINNAWDGGSYLDEVNNRLVIKVRFEGKTIRYSWVKWKKEAIYNAVYYVYGKLNQATSTGH